ncbi:precorrin-6A reductase [Calderihabitans maritimus]|uniref:Precorrin-6x reductase n=1 Tax=Calderihabitans maritimus TaxID=1246530 RepID=A0A1Z5HPR2_9FIRM|nr:precorrin-6A reductase [Calderihabitans maritimus]GAW91522.1 precorrin-6x reductase [Calderihabitans maritimus]
MILLLAGTRDSRQVLEQLCVNGYPVWVSVTTPYAAQLAFTSGAKHVFIGEFSEASLIEFIKEKNIQVVVDATHPFAATISTVAQQACARTEIPYLRYQRSVISLPSHPLIHRVQNIEEAARKAGVLGETIFLTIGSNHLEDFLKQPSVAGKNIIARVLPEEGVIQKCRSLGLAPRQIVAAQGPFSREFNRTMFSHYGAEVVVTKNSGKHGGTEEKIEAALNLGLPIVVIEPPFKGGLEINNFEDLCQVLRRREIWPKQQL